MCDPLYRRIPSSLFQQYIDSRNLLTIELFLLLAGCYGEDENQNYN